MQRSLSGLVIALIAAVAPALALAGNQEIAQQIANQLKMSGQLSDYNITIKYENGSAWLKGRVNNQEQKAAAEAVIRQVPDVKQVYNELQVFPNQAAARGPAVRPAQYAQSAPVQQPAPQAAPVRQVAPAAVPQIPPLQQQPQMAPQMAMRNNGYPMHNAGMNGMVQGNMGPIPSYVPGTGGGVSPVRYDQPHLPNYAWPSYAPHPNYAALTYPRQHSATAWPYIGPFYPYPQVPLGWRRVTLEWDDGWWMLDFDD